MKIDSDYHDQFIELLDAARLWLCDQTPEKEGRVAEAIMSLTTFDPYDDMIATERYLNGE